MPIADLVKQAEQVAATGLKEIVITGINTGDFGRTTGEKFIDLLRALNDVEGIERYRISSIEPNLLTDEIIEFCADDVFAGHIAYIIEMIPETDAVNDVTSKKEDFTVTTVCRDDLVNAGFDAENLSDQDMQNIADVMGDLYCNYSYHEDLLEAARKLGLRKTE
jgi:hypothetical protein